MVGSIFNMGSKIYTADIAIPPFILIFCSYYNLINYN